MGTLIRYWDDQVPKIIPQRIEEESSTQKLPLGTVFCQSNGDEYIYCLNGAAILAPGKLIQATVLNETAHASLALAAAAAGGNVITPTLGAGGTVTANQMAEGTIHIEAGAGALGNIYRIYSHPAAGEAACAMTIYGKIEVALVNGTHTACVKPNLCRGVIIMASPATSKIIGVPLRSVTANYYFWAKKKGLAAVFTEQSTTALVAGKEVIDSPTVDGACEPYVAGAGFLNSQVVGVACSIQVDAEHALIYLKL
jgi:hypothetical protein